MPKLTVYVTLKFQERFIVERENFEDAKDSILSVTSRKLEDHKKDYPEMLFVGYEWHTGADELVK